jgi:hypothetical protein
MGKNIFDIIEAMIEGNSINYTPTFNDERVSKDNEKITYYKNGMVHREDGPAVVYKKDDTLSEYWLFGKRVSKSDFLLEKEKIDDSKIHIIYIDHEKYKITGKQLKKLKETLDIK